jgi:deoxycytidylate deaminase
MVMHAECHALQKLMFWESWGTHLVITSLPCISCAHMIRRRGIQHVYYLHPRGTTAGLQLLRAAHIPVHRIILSS